MTQSNKRREKSDDNSESNNDLAPPPPPPLPQQTLSNEGEFENMMMMGAPNEEQDEIPL